ncbi:MAG: sulfatase-like hydrolase/transferase, partial [Verrucomicrobiae bacterium]|nr:sulfatase-like hydrolase/transferase [Verrucomicrobiae bacterium]
MKHPLSLFSALCALAFPVDRAAAADPPPNIVWIVVDDMSCHFGYQGEPLARTPHVDRLAKEGVVFARAYATAPVCSAFRTAMITSMWQTA